MKEIKKEVSFIESVFSPFVVIFSVSYFLIHLFIAYQSGALQFKSEVHDVVSVGLDAEKTEEKYIVKSGDSINRIANNHIVLPWQLRKANNFLPNTIIHPGQIIRIPQIDWSEKTYIGKASWYGPGFHGKKMANGDVYNQNKILIAHRTFPLGLEVRITNLENGKSVIACVLDRGPYTKKDGKYDREVDLSYGAAKKLGSIKKGIIPVRIEPI